jgi:sporulation protein YlmC with PRC-barrel domain
MIIVITIIIPIITLIFIGIRVFPLTMAQAFILVITGGIPIILITAHRGIMAIIGADTGTVIMTADTEEVTTAMVTDITMDITTGAIITTATIHTTEILIHIHLTDHGTVQATEDITIVEAAIVQRVQLLRQGIQQVADVRLPNVMSVRN